MAYDSSKPFSYGIPDGNYVGKPTTASFYEKDGRLILDVKFMVKDPQTGEFWKNDKGYEWEANKRHWLTTADGAFNERTINGIKEWAKGWTCDGIGAFYWFQNPDANGKPFGNLDAAGEVRLSFSTRPPYGQSLFVHALDAERGRKAFTPDGAVTDQSAIAAKWGAKARTLFASTPKSIPAAPTMPTMPTRPTTPAMPTAPSEEPPPAICPWADYPQTSDGCFAYFTATLGEPYESAKHDEKWFKVYEAASNGKDPDQLGADDVARLFSAIHAANCNR